jgi:hypothetical protein
MMNTAADACISFDIPPPPRKPVAPPTPSAGQFLAVAQMLGEATIPANEPLKREAVDVVMAHLTYQGTRRQVSK